MTLPPVSLKTTWRVIGVCLGIAVTSVAIPWIMSVNEAMVSSKVANAVAAKWIEMYEGLAKEKFNEILAHESNINQSIKGLAELGIRERADICEAVHQHQMDNQHDFEAIEIALIRNGDKMDRLLERRTEKKTTIDWLAAWPIESKP